MIGQHTILKTIKMQIKNGTFPRFSIITGPRGSGKKTLAHWIYNELGEGIFSNRGISVDSVRDAIGDSYRINGTPCIFLFADADTMSTQAKNALLKVTEEPPNDAYFILTVSDMNTVLDTIRSRATVYYMLPYSSDEILKYTHNKDILIYDKIISELCETPGDVDLLCKNGVHELYDYAEKTVDNIATVSGANAFKIANKIAFKDDAEGFDLRLFLRAFQSICAKRMLTADRAKYSRGVQLASSCLSQLNTAGLNKGALFDIFILDIRRAWM